MTLPLDPFGRGALPPTFDRAGRVRLIAEAADALLKGELPEPAARLFLAGAISAWLKQGGRVGDLERTYLRVSAPPRSTMTPARLLASAARATEVEESDTMEAEQLTSPNS